MSESVKLTYTDGKGVEREKELKGKRVGYHLDEGSHWTIWADEKTFAIPFERVCHVEVDKTGGEEED